MLIWDVFDSLTISLTHSLTHSLTLYLYDLGVDKQVLIWDISNGELVAQLPGHTDTIYSLAFSREGNILASGQYYALLNVFEVHS